jgi:hypothetical protein
MRCVSDLVPDDFLAFRQKLLRTGLGKAHKGLGVYALNRAITIIKSMFALAYDMDLIDRVSGGLKVPGISRFESGVNWAA